MYHLNIKVRIIMTWNIKTNVLDSTLFLGHKSNNYICDNDHDL